MADISENPLGGQSSSAAAATSRGPKRCLIRFGNMLKGNKLISGADLNNNTGRRRSNKARISNDANNGDSNQAIEVRKKQNYFLDCHRAYSCIHCGAHLANHDELISKLFQGNHGRAYLFNKVSNIGCKQAVQRELLTGLHAVADIYCDNCETTVGWKYEQAFVPSQKYKEGKYIIELVHILKENNWDLTSYNVKALLDESMLSANKLALNDDDLTDRPSYYYSNNNNNFNRYRRLNNNYYYNRAVRLHQQHQQQQLQASTSSSSASSSTSSPKSSSLSKSLTKSDSCMDFHISQNSNNDNEEDVDATTIILGNNINNDNNNININNQAGDVTNNSEVEVVALETAGTISETCNVNQQRKQSGDSLIIKIEKQPMIELKVCNSIASLNNDHSKNNIDTNGQADVVRRCSNDNDETTTVLIIGANSRDNNNTNQV